MGLPGKSIGMSNKNEPAPLVEVRRGPIVESRHRGHVIALDGDGTEIASLGAPEMVTYLRSSAKPFQALPLLISGAADRFGFSEQELALACASHNGEPIHVEAAASMLRKIGLAPSDLKCGVHWPFSSEVVQELKARGEQPNVLHNNCSGKHAGMLAVALQVGATIGTYDHLDSPVQQGVETVVSQFAGIERAQLAIGIDGCGVPVFGMSVRSMALMYARLVSPPPQFEPRLRDSCRRIVHAMTTYPEFVGGAHERLDTLMIRAAGGKLISKIGAEGVYTVGVLPSDRWPKGLGLALKIEDGEDRRARPTVVIEALRQLGVLDDSELEALAPYSSFPIRNHRGDLVGEVRPYFELRRG
jgi:L-asparaginase II